MDFKGGRSILRNEEDRLSNCIMLNVLFLGRERPVPSDERCSCDPKDILVSCLHASLLEPVTSSRKRKKLSRKPSLWAPKPQPTIRRNSWNQRTTGMCWFKKGNIVWRSGTQSSGFKHWLCPMHGLALDKCFCFKTFKVSSSVKWDTLWFLPLEDKVK